MIHDGETIVELDGATCTRGGDYDQGRLTDPWRMVTTTLRATGGLHPLLPVHTSVPITQARVFDLREALRQVQVDASLRVGQVLLEDILGAELTVLASREVPARQGWLRGENGGTVRRKG